MILGLRRTPRPWPVYLHLRDSEGKGCRMRAGEGFRVNPANVCTSELETILGVGAAKFAGLANGNGKNGR